MSSKASMPSTVADRGSPVTAKETLKRVQQAAVSALVGDEVGEQKPMPTVRPARESELAEMAFTDPTLWRLDRFLMEYPWFSVANAPEMEMRKHQFGEYSITIIPSAHGMATQSDMDVLRYAVSELNRRVEAQEKGKDGLKPERTLVFVAHRFLTATNRDTSKKGYDRLLATLRRLMGTQIETNLASNGQRLIGGFRWIDRFCLLGDDDGKGGVKRLKGVSITISDWLYDAIVEERRVLSFSPEYFKLRSPLDRRLSDIARKCCGRQPSFSVSLGWLHERSGSTAPLKKFRALLDQRIKEDNIIDYTYEIAAPAGPGHRKRLDRVTVIIRPRNPKALLEAHPDAGDDVIEGEAKEVDKSPASKPRVVFPDSGGISYSKWAKLARDNLPSPMPDVNLVADGFRAFCEKKGIPFDAKNIEESWIGFCKSAKPVR